MQENVETNIDQAEQDLQEALICKRCGCRIIINDNKNIIWDENGYGYSTKLCRCHGCNTLNVIEYYEDCSLDINKDTRWYYNTIN